MKSVNAYTGATSEIRAHRQNPKPEVRSFKLSVHLFQCKLEWNPIEHLQRLLRIRNLFAAGFTLNVWDWILRISVLFTNVKGIFNAKRPFFSSKLIKIFLR